MGKVVVNVHKLASSANHEVLQAFSIDGDGDLGQVLTIKCASGPESHRGTHSQSLFFTRSWAD